MNLFQFSVYCILFLIIAEVAAQPETAQSLAGNIISAYEAFNYEETDRLLEIALKEINSLSAQDQIKVYQYAAFRQFQQGDNFQAEAYFWKLLEIDPTFNLDQLTTPPKILSVFQKTKIDFLEGLQQRLGQLEQSMNYRPVPWRSLVFPGWEQWHRGYRLKGGLWMAAGAGCLAGIVQAVARTGQKKQEYEGAIAPEDIRAKYDGYNRLYQSQFYWSYAFIAVWLSSHLDALFLSSLKSPSQLSLHLNPIRPGLSFSFYF